MSSSSVFEVAPGLFCGVLAFSLVASALVEAVVAVASLLRLSSGSTSCGA